MKNQRYYTYSFLTVLGFVEKLRQMKNQSQREAIEALSSTVAARLPVGEGEDHRLQTRKGYASVVCEWHGCNI